jgi:phosphoglycolate phosphatase-like HAD superfamily hydrolase
VLLVHLNALLACKDATTRTIRRTIAEVLPANEIPELTDDAILFAFSKFSRLPEIISHLGIRNLSIDERHRLFECYSRIYTDEGLPLIHLAPGAREFLEYVNRHGTPLAVMSNNTAAAAALLEKLGVAHLIHTVRPHLPYRCTHITQKIAPS